MIKFENPLNGRYYYLEIQEDLLKDKILVCYRGSKSRSISRKILCASQEKISQEIVRISKIRLKRGYELITN